MNNMIDKIRLNPVPQMSKTAVQEIGGRITNDLQSGQKTVIVEYGSGGSTKYFYEKFKSQGIGKYIAVERHYDWFCKVADALEAKVKITESISYFSQFKVLLKKSDNIKVPAEHQRWRKYRRRAIKYFLREMIKNIIFRKSSRFHSRVGTVKGDFPLYLVFREEGFKDQYGESPKAYQYITAPSKYLKGNERRVNVIIDGGPRLEIVKFWIGWHNEHPSVTLRLFLMEAFRPWYSNYLLKEGGNFIGFTENVKISNETYLEKSSNFKVNDPMSANNIEDVKSKELWIWESN